MAIGKILDLFAERGFSSHVKTIDNDAVMKAVIENSKTDTDHKLLFANCVDFDMLWGHRNDEIGFARGLEEFDSHLGEMITQLRDTDLLIITADHGCDPTQKHSTDHTREYVPLLAYGRNFKNGVDLGVRHSFADVACTIADVFDLKHDFPGSSFLKDISET
jgi:phosphopentomutase